MNYGQIIIDGYNGQRTMPLVSYFKQQAKLAERDSFVENADFFNGCKVVVGDWIKIITDRCDYCIKQLNGSINYWQNLFIYDDEEWKAAVKKNGGCVDYQSLNTHHEEQQVDRVQKVKELEQEKEQWQYEKHCIEIYLDDYTIKYGDDKKSFFENTPERSYIKLNYNTLVVIENSILQAEQELIPLAPTIATHQQITIPDNILQALQQAGFIENAAAKPLKWIKSKALLAYFVDITNDKLKIKDSGGRRQIKPFETLFNTIGLQNCINEYKNKTGQLPQGHDDIGKIFSDLKY